MAEDKASVSSIPYIGVFEEAKKAWKEKAYERLSSAGYGDQEIAQMQPKLREKFVDWAVKNMGEDSELGYHPWEVAAGLRAMGFKDLVPEEAVARPEPIDTSAMLAQAKLDLHETSRITQEAANQVDPDEQGNAFTKFLAGLNKQQLQQQASQQRAAEGVMLAPRAVPAALTASIKILDELPQVAISSALRGQNPGEGLEKRRKEVFEKTLYRIPGYDLSGVEPLTEIGVPHWAADVLVEDFMDPASWVMGKPLLLGAGLVGGAAATMGVRGTLMNGRAIIRRLPWMGEKIGGDELLAIQRAFQKGLVQSGVIEEASDIPRILTLKQARKDAALGAEIAATLDDKALGAQSKVMSEFGDKVRRAGGDIVEGRQAGDNEFFEGVNRVYRDGNKEGAAELIEMRLQMATDSDELSVLQRRILKDKGLREAIDPEALRRKDMKVWVYKEGLDDFVKLEAGIFHDIARNPKKFFNPATGKLKREWKSLEKLIGENQEAAFRDYSKLRVFGQNRNMRNAMAALEELRSTHPDEFKSILAGKAVEDFVKLSKNRLERTPAFRAIHFADRARNLEIQLVMSKVHAALGGKARLLADDLVASSVAKDINLEMIDRHPLLRRKESLLTRAFRPKHVKELRAEARDKQHALAWLLGDDLHKEAVLLERERLGLKNVKITAEDQHHAANLRSILDELGEEAQRLGVLDPESMLKDYLPRLRKMKLQGLSHEEAIKVLKEEYLKGNPKYREEGLPFFAFLRNSENAEDLITNPVELIKAYSTSLYRQKYVKPVLRDMVDTALDQRNGLSLQDRRYMLEFAHHQAGGRSKPQLSVANMLDKADDPAVRAAFYGEQENAFLEALVPDSDEWHGFANWIARQASDMWFMEFLGGNIGKPLRNLTQQSLSVPSMGGNVRGWNNLRRGAKRIAADEALQAEYRGSERRWGWNSGFLDFAADELETQLPDIVPRHIRDKWLKLYSLSDNVNRRNTWAGAREFFEQELTRVKAGKKHGLFEGARTFDVEERATLKRLLKNGDYQEAAQHYADATVNNSQWLYSFKNRPKWAREHRLAGMLLVFQTWSMNYANTLSRGFSRSAIGASGLGTKPMFKQMRNGYKYLMPWLVLGAGIEMGGRASGLGGFGDFMFPDLDEMPNGRKVKSNMGFDQEDRTLVPIPKPLVQAGRSAYGTIDPAQGGPILLGWIKDTVLNAGKLPFADERAKALHDLVRAQPRPFRQLDPALSELGKALGIEPEVAFREGIGDQILGALMQMSEDDFDQALRRTQGIPSLSEYENRILDSEIVE